MLEFILEMDKLSNAQLDGNLRFYIHKLIQKVEELEMVHKFIHGKNMVNYHT